MYLGSSSQPWWQRLKRLPRWLVIVLSLAAAAAGLSGGGVVLLVAFPQVAAQNIDSLRDIFGDAAVAQLEAFVLSIEDTAQQWGYRAGLVKAAAPWTDAGVASSPGLGPVGAGSGVAAPDSLAPAGQPLSGANNLVVRSTSRPGLDSANLNSPDAAAWQPAALSPLGSLAGEGVWTSYIQLPTGGAAAYRTFLQPDPLRPYSVAAVVAFNLQATRLHFILGTKEPAGATLIGKGTTARSGLIPAADLQPGVLLATFNGGFKARHGSYGAMADGLTALPPIPGLGVVAIYADGTVKIGEWGRDIQDSPDLVAWRQNGQLLIHNEQVNPNTAQTTEDWGLTIKGAAVTWRSAIGLSADGQTLYYVAGPQLDVAALTRVMAQTGAAQAMQLDINNFWVHFAAIRGGGSSLLAEPLLKGMSAQPDRYLKSYSRDFFYITAASG